MIVKKDINAQLIPMGKSNITRLSANDNKKKLILKITVFNPELS